ncbi:MAG: hypothetical protein C0169_02400 [Thermodesulfobacterium geofontis]|uniref:Uncharacterized protein n=1 Tax=Thermodesulfobacterium geofontis TaxID=1295609 RepID=A0A2N7QFJ6_9BACT|nr:MAG: hypothetical protein C0169_02400 [Thermodesulfobacterium geofontis]
MLVNFQVLEKYFPNISRKLVGRQAIVSSGGRVGFILSEEELEEHKEKLNELFKTQEDLMFGKTIDDSIYILKGEGIYLIEVQVIEV